MEPMLNVKDVAKLLQCSVRHVWRMAEDGRMPGPCSLGRCQRWDVELLHLWIAAGCPNMGEDSRFYKECLDNQAQVARI